MEMENSKEGLGFNGVREHRLLGLLLLPISSQCGLEAFRAIGCLKFNPDSPQKQAPFFMLSEAHMFWWLYRSPQKVESPSWPIVLWLQGGPGGSGIGVGNFLEFGPLDANLKPRNFTWLQEADLLFVDNPIRTGFSYVEDESLVVKTDDEAATDLTTLLKVLSEKNESFQTSPVYLAAKFYGGKYAVTLAVSILKAIQNKELKLTLGGPIAPADQASPAATAEATTAVPPGRLVEWHGRDNP